MNKVFKRTFIYLIFTIFMVCISLMTLPIESHLTLSVFAQEEREIIFENFDIQAVSLIDAMTDKKSGAIFVNFGNVYIAIYGHDFFRIWSYDDSIKFSSDAAHLIRVGENEPFSLIYDKQNNLFPKTCAEAEAVIRSLVKGEEVILRYYKYLLSPFPPTEPTPYEQVDIKLKNTFVGFVYHKAATLFGWNTLGTSPNLPPVKLNIYAPSDPDSKIEVQGSIQENPDLSLIKQKGSIYTYILIGGKKGFSINKDTGMVFCQSDIMGHRLKIYDSCRNILYNERIPFAFDEGLKGEIAAQTAWESAPIGRIVVEIDMFWHERASLYGFRELWQWGVDNLNFPSIGVDIQTGTEPSISTDFTPQDTEITHPPKATKDSNSIDHKGGTLIILECVDLGVTSEEVSKNAEIIKSYINELGFLESRVRRFGEKRFLIELPITNLDTRNLVLDFIKKFNQVEILGVHMLGPVVEADSMAKVPLKEVGEKIEFEPIACQVYPHDCYGCWKDTSIFGGYNIIDYSGSSKVTLKTKEGPLPKSIKITLEGIEFDISKESSFSGSGCSDQPELISGDWSSSSSIIAETIFANGAITDREHEAINGYVIEADFLSSQTSIKLSENRNYAFKAVPWKSIKMNVFDLNGNKIGEYSFNTGILPKVESHFGQCVWWAIKRKWEENYGTIITPPFYPPPEGTEIRQIYIPEENDILVAHYNGVEHYAFIEDVDGQIVTISQFNYPEQEKKSSQRLRWDNNTRSWTVPSINDCKYYFQFNYYIR